MFRTNKNCTLFVLFALLSGVWGCGQQRESASTEETLPKEELAAEYRDSEEFVLWETIKGDFRDGVFRGVSFGDSRQKVRITESFELFEELPDQLGYTHDTRDLETVDVYYHFGADDQVDKVLIDVFLNGKSSAERLWKIAEWHFGSDFGPAAESTDTRRIWRNAATLITVENVSSGLDNGLKITFVPGAKAALAMSAKFRSKKNA